jgi:hypothetical protein
LYPILYRTFQNYFTLLFWKPHYRLYMHIYLVLRWLLMTDYSLDTILTGLTLQSRFLTLMFNFIFWLHIWIHFAHLTHLRIWSYSIFQLFEVILIVNCLTFRIFNRFEEKFSLFTSLKLLRFFLLKIPKIMFFKKDFLA